ncbi:MAG: hypothetical protein WDO56_05020 [Gammaproteobacteria bacterium]
MKLRRPLSRRRGLFLHLLLVAVLLFSQGAAYAHLCSHLKVPSETSGDTGTATTTQLCGQCLVGGPLLSGAGAPTAPEVAPVHDSVAHVSWIASPLIESRRHYAFRSRAPPQPLV